MGKAAGKLLKWSLVGGAGMYAAAAAVRFADHRRSEGLARPTALPDGEPVEGIRSADGTPLYVEAIGEGPTVFLIHGLACNHTIWRYQRAYLKDRYRVVSLDLRGHGRSGTPASRDQSTERLAEDLQAVIEHFDPPEFVVCGHSMGGFTTLKWHERFADGYRGRLKGLVLVDSSGVDVVEGIILGGLVKSLYPVPLSTLLDLMAVDLPPAQRAWELYGRTAPAYLFARFTAFGKRPPAPEVEFQRELIFSTPLPNFVRAMKACLDYHVEPESLSRIEVPVLILVGSLDRLTSRRVNERTSMMIPGSRLRVYEDRGHDTMLECPEEVNRELGSFLEECFR
ncbi:alpha/beta fold hydrolase [Candidatus Solincola sp.]|nr:alpha/beta hydrolase [Actinomycetota bacterium]MDI7252824.1 alpha/beta hydrolase [Actinomycetota bacterium]